LQKKQNQLIVGQIKKESEQNLLDILRQESISKLVNSCGNNLQVKKVYLGPLFLRKKSA